MSKAYLIGISPKFLKRSKGGLETEANQREILKMIENLSSKIDSLSERNSENMNSGANGFQSESVASTSRDCATDSATQDEGLYNPIFNGGINWYSD